MDKHTSLINELSGVYGCIIDGELYINPNYKGSDNLTIIPQEVL